MKKLVNDSLVARSPDTKIVADRVNENAFSRIWKFYYDPKNSIELKPHEEVIRQRLNNIWKLLCDILTDRQAVVGHIKWCEDQGYSIKERMAYEDLYAAKKLFSDPEKQSKAAKRAISSEILMNAINYCVKNKKHMSAARLIKEYNELNDLKNHEEKEDDEWQPMAVNFNSDPETLKKQAAALRKKMQEANALDISHEEL